MSSWIRLINLLRNYQGFRRILPDPGAEDPVQDYAMDPVRVDALVAPDVPGAVIRVVVLVLDHAPWIVSRHVVAVPVIAPAVPVLAVLYVQVAPDVPDAVPLAVPVVVVALEDALDRAEAVVLDVPDALDRAVPVAVDPVEEVAAVQVALVVVVDAVEAAVVLDAMQHAQGHVMGAQGVRPHAQEHVQ